MIDDVPEFKTLVYPVLQSKNLVLYNKYPVRVVEVPVEPCLSSFKSGNESGSEWSPKTQHWTGIIRSTPTPWI